MRTTWAVVALCITTPVAAGFFDGNRVHGWCERDKPLAGAYVAGLFDGTGLALAGAQVAIAFADALDNNKKDRSAIYRGIRRFCAPEPTSLTQAVDVFCGYVSKNPQRRHESATTLFSDSMEEAWPCRGRDP